ncbi:MAG: hypothetical protein ACUVWX_13625 [Kiritimatiellia bacterium]
MSYELAARKETPDMTKGMVITDDLNPIDRIRAAVAMEWRLRSAQAFR